MEELLKKMLERKELAYKSYMSSELTEDEIGVAYAEGVLDGMQLIIDLIVDKK